MLPELQGPSVLRVLPVPQELPEFQVKVMVGGAPVTQGFADEIGADGYSDNANSAVTVAKQLLGKL